MTQKYFADDSHKIPERLLKMSPQELDREIERLEKEDRIKKEARNRQSAVS